MGDNKNKAVPPAGAIDSGYDERATAIYSASPWSDFRDKFQSLVSEEKQGERFLQAYCSYEEHPDVFNIRRQAGWASALNNDDKIGLNETPEPVLVGTLSHALAEPIWQSEKERNDLLARGAFCLLEAPIFGLWMLSKNGGEDFRERFQKTAAEAGLALASLKRTGSVKFPVELWLHSLFQYLVENKSVLLEKSKSFNGRGEPYKAGIIKRVCEASVIFCSRLEREFFEVRGAAFDQRGMIEPAEVRLRLPSPSVAPSSRKGYRVEVNAWMEQNSIDTVPLAACRLGISESTLKSIRSDKGQKRYSDETLKRILAKIDKPKA